MEVSCRSQQSHRYQSHQSHVWLQVVNWLVRSLENKNCHVIWWVRKRFHEIQGKVTIVVWWLQKLHGGLKNCIVVTRVTMWSVLQLGPVVVRDRIGRRLAKIILNKIVVARRSQGLCEEAFTTPINSYSFGPPIVPIVYVLHVLINYILYVFYFKQKSQKVILLTKCLYPLLGIWLAYTVLWSCNRV